MDSLGGTPGMFASQLAIFVLLGAAVGAAWAGITGRRRHAVIFVLIAIAALVVPIAWTTVEFSSFD